MGKGTPSMGKRQGKTVHIKCRRCGRRAYHVRNKHCGACGFGETKKIRHYTWMRKTLQRVRVV